jgi:mycotoxin biosynthesis protein UstYa
LIVPNAEEGIEYEVRRFKGTFGLKNEFTGVGIETDAAWDNITDGEFITQNNKIVDKNNSYSPGRRCYRHHKRAMGGGQRQRRIPSAAREGSRNWTVFGEFRRFSSASLRGKQLIVIPHHCFGYLPSVQDLLRKSLHREYYDKHEGSFAGAPESVVQGHLQHCVETIRQTIMCHGDISLLTYNWVEGRE